MSPFLVYSSIEQILGGYMVITQTNTQPLNAEDLEEIDRFQSHLTWCVSTGTLFFDDLNFILLNIPTNQKVIAQKLNLTRKLIWENMQAGGLTLDWQPYRKS